MSPPMARTRLHSDQSVLDATAEIVVARGARSASINAIAAASGAPVGSIYHRFESRDGVLLALWERALRRFHAAYLPAEVPGPDPLATGAAMAEAVVEFARTEPRDARLLMTLRRADLLDRGEPLEDLNSDLVAAVEALAGATGRSPERVRMAVIDLPYGSVRRHLERRGAIGGGLRAEVGSAARALLAGGQAGDR